MSDESYNSPKGHHQIGASPIGCQCLVILYTCVCSAIAGPSAIDLETLFFCWNGCVEQSFWCGRGGWRRGTVCVTESSWLYVAILLASIRCLCWALFLRLSNCIWFFFFNFLLTVCIIGLQLVFSIWICGKIGSLSILSASASRCLVYIQWLGICIRICTACTVVSFPIWFVDVFGWFAWRRGCEINRGRARAEHIMTVNTNLNSVSKMHWEWNKTFTYTRSIWGRKKVADMSFHGAIQSCCRYWFSRRICHGFWVSVGIS